jgi:hypothetical protein
MIINNGLGATLPPTSSLIATGVTAASSVAGATGVTASLLAAIGIGAQAVPIVGTIVGGIALAISALGLGNGCGPTCTESTTVVNNTEPYMQQNLAAAQAQAQANGGCLTSAEVATLEANWQQLWNYVLQSCGQIPAPGGTQCISDRSPGGKYDWTAYYLTPIKNIPVCPNSVGSNVDGGVSSNNMLLFMGGMALLGLVMFGGGNE